MRKTSDGVSSEDPSAQKNFQLTAGNAVRKTVWTILLRADVANGTGIKGEHIVLVLMPRQGVR
jgi:hypothetical protein